eukprot:SAG25_NODE_2784_length_1385_cov_0.985226_3_plen_124_part_00
MCFETAAKRLRCTPALLQFHAGERDMCVMQHEVVVEYCAESAAAAGLTPAGATGSAVTDVRTSHLILFGDSEPESDTAMAKTVGLTAAAGVELVLSGPGSGGCKWGLPGGGCTCQRELQIAAR